MVKFIISIAGLGVALLTVIMEGVQFHWFASAPTYTIEIILFLGITTAFIFYFLIRRTDPQSFTQSYLLSIVLKMLVCGAFILVIIFIDGSGAFANASLFLVTYVLFTVLEVGFLFKRINSRKR